MYSRKAIFVSLFIIFIILLSTFTGCTSSKTVTGFGAGPSVQNDMVGRTSETTIANESPDNTVTASPPAIDGNAGNPGISGSTADGTEKSASANDLALAGSTASTDSTDLNLNEILMQRKIIRNADLSLEVEDFDVAYGKINTMISAFGFVQETNIKKEKYYVDSKEKLLTKGVIVLRVDKSHFDEILNGIKSLGLVYDEMITSNDVTDQYFDVDSRLKLLRLEESRLDDYLSKVTDPDIMFKTESRLTDIRHEIESLTGTLNKLGSMVDLSTITLNLSEKEPGVENVSETKSFLDKLWGSFTKSVNAVVGFIGDILVFIIAALPVLLILALFAFILYLILRAASKKKRLKKGDTSNAGSPPDNPAV